MAKQRKGRVVGLGLCVMDHLYLVQGDAPGEERVRYVARQQAPGGMIATALTSGRPLPSVTARRNSPVLAGPNWARARTRAITQPDTVLRLYYS